MEPAPQQAVLACKRPTHVHTKPTLCPLSTWNTNPLSSLALWNPAHSKQCRPAGSTLQQWPQLSLTTLQQWPQLSLTTLQQWPQLSLTTSAVTPAVTDNSSAVTPAVADHFSSDPSCHWPLQQSPQLSLTSSAVTPAVADHSSAVTPAVADHFSSDPSCHWPLFSSHPSCHWPLFSSDPSCHWPLQQSPQLLLTSENYREQGTVQQWYSSTVGPQWDPLPVTTRPSHSYYQIPSLLQDPLPVTTRPSPCYNQTSPLQPAVPLPVTTGRLAGWRTERSQSISFRCSLSVLDSQGVILQTQRPTAPGRPICNPAED